VIHNGLGEDPLQLLAAAVSDARHPALLLSCFVAESLDEDQILDPGDGLDDLGSGVPEQVRRDAELRRAALVVASSWVVERCLVDLVKVEFDDAGHADPDEANDSLVYEAFPERHRPAYDSAFFRRVLVSAVKVAYDLADPNGGPAACTAEEILRSYIGRVAVELCSEAGLGEPFLHPDQMLLEDTDFESLYVDAMDGLEDDPALQATINLDVAPVGDWFAPFNSRRIVHPYARTEPRREFELHDLRRRLIGLADGQRASIDWSGLDDPAPIEGMAAISEVVELARAAVRRDPVAGVWVSDPTHAEDSFGELIRAATLSERGSGWLTWEPHANAGVVRTDGVVLLEPHRHYPIGADQAWVDVSFGSRIVSVPLSAVVSFEPDPEPRRRWNDASAGLGG
jgi:hypothetical protein